MTRYILIVSNLILVNIGFLLSFWFRYGLPFPRGNFLAYRNSYLFITLIYISASIFFGVYKERFKTSWDLFKRIFGGLALGTLLSIVFVYVFRQKFGAFPTSVFGIAFFVNLLLIFKINQFVLKSQRRIKKQVIILGEGKVDDIVSRKAIVEKKQIDKIEELLHHPEIDEIVVTENIANVKDLNLLLYLQQKSKAQVLFSPAVYMGLLPEKINGNSHVDLLRTFIGRRSDLDEFLIRMLDVSASLILLILSALPMLVVSILIKLSSKGTIVYKQKRVGKDGKIFILYKFRTMVEDAEKEIGPVWAQKDDPRITKIGKILRVTRFDELPQLINVLYGHMSLVGPRPERPYFVKLHKALQELRLAVKPGLTGLAQVRSFYDLHPKHKIKYDYLYIQKRSFWFNAYILLQTIPVVLLKKGR